MRILSRVLTVAAVLAGAMAFSARRVDAAVHGLWRDQEGTLYCGSACATGQACCEIKVLPAG